MYVWNGSAWEQGSFTAGSLLANVVEDTTPQLGGDLDLNGNNITGTGNIDGRDVSADGTKLDGIEAGATADQTAGEIKTAYESNANTNAFTDAEQSKLTGIEAGADVTDTANVTAAGALMDSEVTNLAQVKAFDSSDYATAAQGTLADSALQSGDNISVGTITADDALVIESTSGYGNVEIGGPSGAYIDLKSPFSDDYDGRLITNGDGLVLSAGTGQGIDLQFETSTKLATSATGVSVTGAVDVDLVDATGGVTFDPPGAGTDTATDVAIAIPRGNRIVGYNDGYIRTLLDYNTSGTIEIGENNTSLVSDITLRPGATGSVILYEGGSTKLATTSTGIDVTGGIDVVADGADKRIAIRTQNTSGGAAVEAQVNNYWSGATYTGTALVQYDSAATGTTVGLSNANLGALRFQNGSSGLIYTNGGTPLVFGTAASERMRIDSSGNLLVGATSGSDPLTVSGVTLSDAVQEGYTSLSGTTPSIDADTAGSFALSTSGNTTFTFSSVTSGRSVGFVLKITAGGTHTITWPASVDWAGATAPDAPASGETDVLVFYTVDGGTTWYGALAIDAAG